MRFCFFYDGFALPNLLAFLIFLWSGTSFGFILHTSNILSGPIVSLRAFASSNLRSDYLRGSDLRLRNIAL